VPGAARPVQADWIRTSGSLSLSFTPGFGPGREAVTGIGLLEVLTDQLAVLGQELIEMLVDVLLADGFRGQVEVLDLLKSARALASRILIAVVTRDVRCHQLVLGAFGHRARSARILSG